MSATAAGAAVNIGEATQWQIQTSRDLADDSAFGDTWHTNVMGLLGWTISAEGHYDTAQVTPFDAAIATGAVRLYVYPNQSDTAKYYYGTCWPVLSVTVPLGGVAAFSLSGTGDGQLAAN